MPKALERRLKRDASRLVKAGKMSGGKDAKNAYVYGTLRKIEKRHQAKGGRPGKYLKNV